MSLFGRRLLSTPFEQFLCGSRLAGPPGTRIAVRQGPNFQKTSLGGHWMFGGLAAVLSSDRHATMVFPRSILQHLDKRRFVTVCHLPELFTQLHPEQEERRECQGNRHAVPGIGPQLRERSQ